MGKTDIQVLGLAAILAQRWVDIQYRANVINQNGLKFWCRGSRWVSLNPKLRPRFGLKPFSCNAVADFGSDDVRICLARSLLLVKVEHFEWDLRLKGSTSLLF